MTFEEYVSTRGPALVRLARLIAGDEHRGEDLAQEVLAKAYVRWRRIATLDHPDRYLRRMLVNANASWWRRRSNREIAVEPLVDRPSDGDHGTDSAERDEMWRLLGALPARQRAALVLRFYEDLDDAAIAEILDCSPVTVRTHVMRALQALRRRLDAAPDPATRVRS